MKALKTVYVIASMLWLAMLFAWAGMTLAQCFKSPKKQSWSVDAKLPGRVHADMLEGCWLKDELVDINGGWARVLGQRMCNEVLKLRDGQLTRVAVARNSMKPVITAMMDFNSFCRKMQTPCLFVGFPYKLDRRSEIIPRGAPKDYSNEILDAFLDAMSPEQYFDCRPIVANSCSDISENFFRTDHHWKFSAAFKVFPNIVNAIIRQLDLSDADVGDVCDGWEQKKLFRPFLGSSGRRTGRLYAGMDDVVYYLPTFKNDIICRLTSIARFRRGDFMDTMIYPEYMKWPKSWQLDNAYCIYGTNTGEMHIHNDRAPVAKHVLVIKDSYAIPLYSFLVTVFQDVSIFDLRKPQNVSVAEYIKLAKPDIVTVMYGPRELKRSPFFEFGNLETSSSNQCEILRKSDEIKIESNSSEYNHAVLFKGLKRSSKLAVAIGSVLSSSADCPWATIAVYDNKKWKNMVFDRVGTNVKSLQQVVFAVPDQDGDYRLVVYPGEPGKTAGNEVTLHDVTVKCLEEKKGLR